MKDLYIRAELCEQKLVNIYCLHMKSIPKVSLHGNYSVVLPHLV